MTTTSCPEFVYGDGDDASEEEDNNNKDEEEEERGSGTASALDYTSAKLAFIEREFLAHDDDEDDGRTKIDMYGTFYPACARVKLTRNEYIDACKERSASGRCGWRACSERVDVRGQRAKKYDVDAKDRVVREGVFVHGFCTREHMLEAEKMAKMLETTTTTDAKRASTTPGPRQLSSDVIKADVVERVVSASSSSAASMSMKKPLSKEQAMAQAMAVDGYVPRAERRNKTDAVASSSSAAKKVTWNEEEIGQSSSTNDDDKDKSGVFYFDTYGEGKKPSKDFVPSIGGRFSEGQLRTEPREDAPIVIPGDDKDNDDDGEALVAALTSGSGLEGKTPEELALMAEDLARKMLATKLTGNPLEGFGDDDDDDDDMSDATMNDTDDDDGDGESNKFSATPRSMPLPQISQFGTTWMAVDNLVTDATFAFLRGDKTYADILPGRTKYSVSVSETWNTFLAKCVPALLLKLNIGAETRRIEQKLTTLLRTFTFNRPVPSLTSARWDFIAMLFVECVVESDQTMKTLIVTSDTARDVCANAEVTNEELELLRRRLRGDDDVA